MGVLIGDAELANIQSLYPLLKIKPLTGQQEKLVMLVLRGMSRAAAERESGYSPGNGKKVLKRPEVQAILEYLREEEFDSIRIDRDKLTAMLLSSHAKAATATEEIMAVRELGKMHDLYEDAKHKQKNVEVNISQHITNVKQIEKLSDDQLMALCGEEVSLDPEKSIIEGECTHE